MNSSSFVLGYHGCDRELGEKVLAGETTLRQSSNDYDWLAEGIYFWQDDAARALHWAKSAEKHAKKSLGKVKTPFVIGAIIELGHCLDLLQYESIRLVADAYQDLCETHQALSLQMPRNRLVKGELALRQLDCAVIRSLHQQRSDSGLPAFDTVRAAFPEGRELYPGAGFQDRSHIQICVRNPKQVIGYFRVVTKPPLG